MSESQTTTTIKGHPPTEKPAGGAALFLALMRVAPLRGGEIEPGVIRFLTGYSSGYLIATNEAQTEFCMVDSGADPDAKEILAILRYKGLDASAIKAILLTHAHADHMAGVRNFPAADIYVGEGDRAVVEGTGVQDGFIPRLSGAQPKLAIRDKARLHSVQDGQTITVGIRAFRVFTVPGHTKGSVVYLMGDVLFCGDATTFGKKGEAQKPPLPVTLSIPQALTSLARLVKRFDDQHIQVRTVVPNHSGTGSFAAIRNLTDHAT